MGWADASKFSIVAYLPIFAAAFLPEFVKKLIEKKGRENVKMPYFIKKMLEKRAQESK